MTSNRPFPSSKAPRRTARPRSLGLAAWLAAGILPCAAAGDLVPLGPEFVATSDTAHVQKQPWMDGDDQGNFVLVYSKGHMFARRFDRDGVPLGPDFLVNPTINFSLQDEGYVDVDPKTGDFVICWSDRHGNDGWDMGCGVRFYAADGTPRGPEFFLNSHTQFSQFEPYVAFSPKGVVFAVWTDAGTDGVAGVIGRLFDRFGNPLTGEFLVNLPNSKSQIDPSVATDRSGNFVVAYVDASGQTGEPREILARLYAIDGTPKGPPFLVNSDSTGMQREPFVEMSATGEFVVAWHDESGNDGDGFGVYARAFFADGTPKGPQFVVAETTAGHQRDPHVAMDYSGNALVSWTHDAFGDADIRARRFDRDGNPLGGEFGLHEAKPGNQSEPKVAMTQSGERLVAAWFDDDSDSYVRVFDLPMIVPVGRLAPGQTTFLELDFPGQGTSPYVLPAALSASPGISVPLGRTLHLAPDPIFFLTLSEPNNPIFTGMAGRLQPDGTGLAAVNLPNDPAASGMSLSFAALTLNPQSPGGVDLVTDTLTLTIE